MLEVRHLDGMLDELDELDYADIDDEVEVDEHKVWLLDVIDDEIDIQPDVMLQIVDDEVEVEVIDIDEIDEAEQLIYVINQIEVIDLCLQQDEIAVMSAVDIVYIDLLVIEHLLLFDNI